METPTGYIFGGTWCGANGMLTGTDFNGNVIWAAQHGGGTYVNCYRFSPTTDGRFITTGNVNDGTLLGLMLMKTAPNGVVACQYFDALPFTPDSLVTFGSTTGCATNTVTPTLSYATLVNANAGPDGTVVVCYPLAVSDLHQENHLNAYPVPANDLVTIVLDKALLDNSLATVYDMVGRRITSYEIEPGASVVNLDVSDLSNGAYVVTISSSERTATQKISVQR